MSAVLAGDTCAAKITGVTYTPPGGSPQDHITLSPKSYSITLDKAHSPYVDATLVVPTPEIGAVALMDPTTLTLRCTITLTKQWYRPASYSQSRTFNLLVRSVKNDAASGETTLGLSSDEALLVIDMYAGNAVDTTYEAYQASLRSIVTAALATYGFTLAGTPSVDADYTITATATNLHTNPKLGTGTTNWLYYVTSGTTTVTRQTTGGPSPISTFYRSTATATLAAPFGLYTAEAACTIVAGTTYEFSAWVRSSAATQVQLNAQNFSSPSGGSNVGNFLSSNVTLVPNIWTRLTLKYTAPAGATNVRLFLVTVSSMAAGVTLDVTGYLFTTSTGIHDTEYWDGALGDTTHYVLAWTGIADASTSTRTRLDSRDPSVLDRQPGVAMWDWLNGLVQTVGYRLFCDEARVWRMVDNTYAVAGSIALSQAINLIQSADTIDIGQADTDQQGYVQKVQVVYQWIDKTTAANLTAYDFAGTGHGPGIKITINTPYPGPGYAAALLARLQGREHTLDLLALSDLTATPGNDVTVSLPIISEAGKIASVTWTDGDEMSVGTEGLITIPANAWALAVGPWSGATGSWAAATGTN